jgi:hypothetical protein
MIGRQVSASADILPEWCSYAAFCQKYLLSVGYRVHLYAIIDSITSMPCMHRQFSRPHEHSRITQWGMWSITVSAGSRAPLGLVGPAGVRIGQSRSIEPGCCTVSPVHRVLHLQPFVFVFVCVHRVHRVRRCDCAPYRPRWPHPHPGIADSGWTELKHRRVDRGTY